MVEKSKRSTKINGAAIRAFHLQTPALHDGAMEQAA